MSARLLALGLGIATLTGCVASSQSWRPNVASGGVRALAVTMPGDDALLDDIERTHFQYFVDQSDPDTGLTRDRSQASSPASMAAVGFSLASYPIAVRRGWITRVAAASYTRRVLTTLWNAPQGDDAANSSGSHGFFYHFVDPKSCQRAWKCEVSTIDTALLMAGVRVAREYYNGADEADLRDLSDRLYQRVDWAWSLDGGQRLSLGWTPETGFMPYHWGGYNEAMVMMLLGLGSPTHPLPAGSWQAFVADEKPVDRYGQHFLAFPPLFGHQYSHSFVDFRGIQDATMKGLGEDYFENSRRAVVAQQAYAVANPMAWKGYGALDWGLTACDGPGDSQQTVAGVPRKFFGYMARGAPDGPDDGTIAPTAAAASLPFAPELVMPTLRHWKADRPELWGPEGFADAFNPTLGWVDKDRLGIDQGPVVLMTENQRSGMIWGLLRSDPALKQGLNRAGFSGGWLAGGQ